MKKFAFLLLAFITPFISCASELTLKTPDQQSIKRGYAIAVWVVEKEGKGVIQTSTYNNTSKTWSPAKELSSSSFDASNPHVSKDPYGDAVVVWESSDGDFSHIEAAFFSSGSGTWTKPAILSSPSDDAKSPKVSKDVSGQTIAVWEVSDHIMHGIEASIYSPETGQWSAPMVISDTAFHSFDPQVSIDTDGNGITLFRRADSGKESVIQSATYLKETGTWTYARDVSKSGFFATTPQIGTDDSGNAIAVVHPQGDSNYTIMIHAPLGHQVVSYETGEPIYNESASSSTASTKSPTSGELTVNSSSSRGLNGHELNSSDYRIQSDSSQISPLESSNALEPSTLTSSSTQQLSTTQSLSLGDTTPGIPTNFQLLLQKNIFPTQIEWYTTLTWDAPTDPSDVTAYRLYLNGSLLETVSASDALSYEVHNIDKNASYTFELCSITASGTESTRIILRLF